MLTPTMPSRIGTCVPCLISFLTLCYNFLFVCLFLNRGQHSCPVSAAHMLLAISWGASNLPASRSQAEYCPSLSSCPLLIPPLVASWGPLPSPRWNFDWLDVVLVCAGHPSCWVAVWKSRVLPRSQPVPALFPTAPRLILVVGWLV